MKCKYCNAEIENDARFCPNCGKDLSRLTKCINCGEFLDDEGSYCPHCGTKQPEYENKHEDAACLAHEVAEECQEYQRKHIVRNFVIVISVLLALIGGIIYFFTQRKSTPLVDRKVVPDTTVVSTTQVDTTVVDSIIMENNEEEERKYVHISEAQKPNGSDGIRVELIIDNDGEQILNIYQNGELIQEFEKMGYAGGGGQDSDEAIHIVDYNFDGNLDILYGPAQDRTSNTLFVWDKSKEKFVISGRIGEAQAQDPLFNYKEKAVYTTGSGGWNYGWWSKSKWVNGELKDVEHLEYVDDIDDANQGSEEKVNAHYTLKDESNNTLLEVNSVEELPKNWQTVISKHEKIRQSR